jgi:tetratricopeptide (TPR) repeat protein
MIQLDLAFAEAFEGNLDDCERTLDELFRGSPAEGEVESVAFQLSGAHAFRGLLFQLRGGLADAARSFAKAEEIAASADPMTQILAGDMLASFGEARGALPGAIELAAGIMNVAEEFGAPNLRAAAQAMLARAHALRGEWQAAARLFEESLMLANEHHTYLEMEGRNLASLAHAYVELGEPERAKATAERALGLVQERGGRIQELGNVMALARAEVALGNDAAVDPLLARCEMLIAETGAWAYRPHLAEVRAARARQRGDGAGWREALAEAHRLFTENGATGHAERIARALTKPA